MNSITKKLLETVAGWKGKWEGACSLRENGACVEMRSTRFVEIAPKEGLPGLDIHIQPGCAGETVAVPACITDGGIDDLVYNDFHIAAGARATIVAGCGIHTENGEPARHSGIHRFFLGPGAQVRYVEKHAGSGDEALRAISPETEIYLEESAQLEMDTAQLGGVGRASRSTKAVLAAGARLFLVERLVTQGREQAKSAFTVRLDGAGAAAELASRAVARAYSRQSFSSWITGSAPCKGHSACDALVSERAQVDAAPSLCARHAEAALIHEAAIGRIAGEQILKLRTLGLSQAEAEQAIIEGFLS